MKNLTETLSDAKSAIRSYVVDRAKEIGSEEPVDSFAQDRGAVVRRAGKWAAYLTRQALKKEKG